MIKPLMKKLFEAGYFDLFRLDQSFLLYLQ